MNQYAINKYPPRLYKKGRFLREDWTSCSDIGKATPQGVLSREEYLRIEQLYVAAVERVVGVLEPGSVRAHDVEFWEDASDALTTVGLDDVFDGSAAPIEGEPLAGDRLVNVVRRCLREVAWLELAAEPRLLIHFGYDLRILAATKMPLDPALQTIRSDGLFVYDSQASLPTLEAWLAR